MNAPDETVADPRPTCFTPRRLGHVNVFVSDVERTKQFLADVAGLAEVYYEREFGAYFFSNGNSHHDYAIFEARDEDRYDVDGVLQISRERGNTVRLNHVAIEVDTSADIAAGYALALERGTEALRAFDHGISMSTYYADPDGVSCEVYADSIDDWREFYQERPGELVTSRWDPLTEPGLTSRHSPVDPELEPLPGAVFPALRVERVALVVSDLSASLAHYVDVLGLRPFHVGADWALLAGYDGTPSVGLFQVDGVPVGLHHTSFAVAHADAVAAGAQRLAEMGIEHRRVDGPFQISVTVPDPDRYLLQFVALDAVDLDPPKLAGVDAATALLEVF